VLGGRFGGRSPASPARQGVKWGNPQAWHDRAVRAAPLRRARRVAREAGKATYPKLLSLDAVREDGFVRVDYRLDPAPARQATRLLVTLHRGRDVLASHAAEISGAAGSVEIPDEGAELVRASAYNALRQRSDPLETVLEGGTGRAG
jgi:hypothetical protein